MQRNYSKRRSREEMAIIVAEYENSDFTREEIAKKYGIHCPSSISNWKKRLENSKRCVSLQPRSTTYTPMAKKELQPSVPDVKQYSSVEEELHALREELSQTKLKLEWQQKRTLALETLIEIAEEHGMPVKKCWAKQ